MAKKSSMTFVEDFAFYEQLWNYYAFIGWRNFTIYELVVCFN